MFGSGTVARCLREMDWASHELGPPENWPESLRVALSTMLAAQAPMQLLWGPRGLLFYNDACVPQVAEHPRVLGRRAPDALSSIWETFQPAFERCRTEEVVVEHDHGVLTPIPVAGDVGGVVVALGNSREHEETLALIGHELRNPLSVISTMIQVLVLRAPSREVDFMARAIAQLTRMIDDVVDVSRLERGKLTVERTYVDVASVTSRAIEIAQPLIEEKQARLRVVHQSTPLTVEADRERLAKVIASVIANVLLQDGSREVTVQSMRVGDSVRIAIRHEGSGTAAEHLRRILAGTVPRRTGHLGLALARSIVELHDGTIRQQAAEQNVDAQCVIELPVATQTEALPPRRVTATKIMLVEDNDDAARALKITLEQLGYVVALAHNGPIALNVAQVFAPDIVLLDIGLPVMDGWELARRIRERCTNATFVAVTARDGDSDREASAQLGFAEHFVKPIDIAALHRIVEGIARRE